MGLLDKLKSSILGLRGAQPANFGVDPLPPGSLHDQYSVDGKPNVKWRTISGTGMKPQPSRLDELDPNAPKLNVVGVVSKVYKSAPGQKYLDNKPR
jgi:hypothetical protein